MKSAHPVPYSIGNGAPLLAGLLPAAITIDFFLVPPEQILFVVADVQGHGVSSALIMSNVQAALRALRNGFLCSLFSRGHRSPRK